MSSPKKKRYSPIRRTDRNAVGETVRRLREARDLTREELVARAQVIKWDISAFALKRIESGEREVTDIELKKLARILRVRAAVLLE
jgi:transcriptional regulator with XRE-family HTH domain